MAENEGALYDGSARRRAHSLALLRTSLQRAADEAGRCYLLVAVAPPDDSSPAPIPFGVRADLADEWARRVGEPIAPQGRSSPLMGPRS
jgi:hypothetical protein